MVEKYDSYLTTTAMILNASGLNLLIRKYFESGKDKLFSSMCCLQK